MTARPKIPDLLTSVREKVESGKLRYSAHAGERMLERGIIRPEVEYILKTGRHDKKKDQFNEMEKAWETQDCCGFYRIESFGDYYH